MHSIASHASTLPPPPSIEAILSSVNGNLHDYKTISKNRRKLSKTNGRQATALTAAFNSSKKTNVLSNGNKKQMTNIRKSNVNKQIKTTPPKFPAPSKIRSNSSNSTSRVITKNTNQGSGSKEISQPNFLSSFVEQSDNDADVDDELGESDSSHVTVENSLTQTDNQAVKTLTNNTIVEGETIQFSNHSSKTSTRNFKNTIVTINNDIENIQITQDQRQSVDRELKPEKHSLHENPNDWLPQRLINIEKLIKNKPVSQLRNFDEYSKECEELTEEISVLKQQIDDDFAALLKIKPVDVKEQLQKLEEQRKSQTKSQRKNNRKQSILSFDFESETLEQDEQTETISQALYQMKNDTANLNKTNSQNLEARQSVHTTYMPKRFIKMLEDDANFDNMNNDPKAALQRYSIFVTTILTVLVLQKKLENEN